MYNVQLVEISCSQIGGFFHLLFTITKETVGVSETPIISMLLFEAIPSDVMHKVTFVQWHALRDSVELDRRTFWFF